MSIRTVVAAFALSSFGPSTVTTPGPESPTAVVWTFDRLENIGGHHTTVLGHPKVIDSPIGKAVEFDGRGDALFVDNHPLAGAETFTWEAIFRPDGGDVEQRWFHLSEQDPATGEDTGNRMLFEIRVAGDKWFLDSYNESRGEGKALMNRAALHPLGRWYHVATVYDGREVRNYVDGVQEGAAPIRLAPQGAGHTSIGVRINKVYFFKGAVHLTRFTRAAIPPSEFLPAPPKSAPQTLDPPIACDLSEYTPRPGLSASVEQNLLVVGWTGARGADLRLRYAIDRGAPVIHDLAARPAGGRWSILGQGLRPEFRVTTGVRRMSEQQAEPLRALGIDITPEVIDKNKWYAFWDAPLNVPGVREGERTPRNIGLPRRPDEIRRAAASFATASCSVRTDGERLEATFPGLSMGIFTGSLRFTVYRGTNLIRMEAIARTQESAVAYKYEAGLKGFSTATTPRVIWRDTGGHPQQYRFGGPVNDASVAVKAANRVLVAEGDAGSLATFPPPHTFFFTREVDTNLGYVWYRKDADAAFAIGIRQADREEVPQYAENFALFNAPPGTSQRMAVYFYASPESAEATREAVLAFTHGDTFKAIPGYKTFVNHFHLGFTDRLRESGSLDTPIQDLSAMKALGLNIVGLSDFHFELHREDPGALRFGDQKDYFEGCRRASDADFLVVPWEEPSAYFGGHYNVLWPKNVYWSKVRRAGQPFTETDAAYGKVYHAGSTADMQQMLDAEGGYWYHAHPRTKGTTGYPDAIFDKAWVRNDRYLGVAFKPGMGMDLSEERLCDWRCFDAVDTMNNLIAHSGLRPKYVIADIDTYKKGPEDDLYPNFPVNYVKLDRTPGPDDAWNPILQTLRDGRFFVTTGEILITSYSVEGTGSRRTITADVEWTFPLEFAEVVWGDGRRIDRQIVPARDLGAFGKKRFTIPFDADGKAWVRFAVWDSAGDGAFVEPTWIDGSR